jgi:hypothetical protein
VIAVELITLFSPTIRVHNHLQVGLETSSTTELPGEPATTSNTPTAAQHLAEETVYDAGASYGTESVDMSAQQSSAATATASTTADTTVDDGDAAASTVAAVGDGVPAEETSEQLVSTLKLSRNTTYRM